ncbi:MAG: vWA domain-containing protein [Bryobacteraceae bacterium]|jgi:hypothetical protein
MRVIVAVVVCASLAWAEGAGSVAFRAVDRKTGAPVAGLQAADIEIREGKDLRPVTSLRFGDIPMDLVLVLDAGQDTVDISRDVALGARLACSEMAAGDRLALITFTSGWKVRFRFLGKENELSRKIERSVSASTTWFRGQKVFDAIQAAVDLFPAPPDAARTRAVLAITNSLDRDSKAAPAAIVAAARQRDAAVFTVSVPTARPNVPGVPIGRSVGPVAEQLEQITQPTGGESRVQRGSGYILRENLERIRSRYVASYVAASGARPVVRLSPAGAIAFPNAEIRGAW